MSAPVTTVLVDDAPAVVVIGSNSLLLEQVKRLFHKANFTVESVPPEKVIQDPQLLEKNWYKVVWINEPEGWSNKQYLSLCAALQKQHSPLLVLLPICSTISDDGTNDAGAWLHFSQLQTQVIVDCSFYLPTAAFIFTRDLVRDVGQLQHNSTQEQGAETGSVFYSGLECLTTNIQEHVVKRVQGSFFPQTVADCCDALSPLLFRPFTPVSIQLRGKEQPVSELVAQICEEYERYHQVTLTQVTSSPTLSSPIPFSTEIKETTSDRAVVEFIQGLPIVAQTPAPTATPSKLPEPHKTVVSPAVSRESVVAALSAPNTLPRERDLQGVIPSVSELPSISSNSSELGVATHFKEPLISEQTSKKQTPPTPITVKQDLQKIFQTSRTENKTTHVHHLATVRKKVSKKTKRKQALFYMGVGVAGVALGLLFLASTFFITTRWLQESLQSAIVQAAEGESVDLTRLQQLSRGVSFQTKSYSAVVSLPQLLQASHSVEMSERLSQFVAMREAVRETQTNLLQALLNVSQVDETTLAPEAMTSVTAKAYEEVAYLQSVLEVSEQTPQSEEDQTSFAESEARVSEDQELYKKLEAERRSLLVKQQLFPLLADFLSSDGRAVYAVLLQNDQELRPTGGFLQAVGLLTFSSGRLVSTTTQSSYDLDKKVLGEVSPPPEVEQYLGEKRWYLRDSNWSPSFPDAAAQTAWFIEQATSQEIQGVVAINSYTLESLLAVTGPIEVPEFNEVLSSKNIRERLEFHSEVVLVDTNGVPDYSTLILERVLAKIKSLPTDKYPELLQALAEATDQQNVFIYSTDQAAQSTWQALGWAGTILSPQCPTQLSTVPCRVDTIAQFEANVGVNKANYYLEKEVQHTVTITDAEIQHSRNITYVNTAQSESWPKGPYKSYVRLYLPEDVRDIQLQVSGQSSDQTQLKRWQEGRHTVLGFYLEVPIQKSTVVSLQFSSRKPSDSSFSYALFDQKQSGVQSVPFSLTINYESKKPVLLAPQAKIQDSSIMFSQVQDENLFFGVQF